MPNAPLPDNEANRLATLYRYAILDLPTETVFDRIATLTARLFHTPVAFIGLMDRNRQWLKARVGLSDYEIERDQSFCAYALLSSEPTVVCDTTNDPRFVAHPLVHRRTVRAFLCRRPDRICRRLHARHTRDYGLSATPLLRRAAPLSSGPCGSGAVGDGPAAGGATARRDFAAERRAVSVVCRAGAGLRDYQVLAPGRLYHQLANEGAERILGYQGDDILVRHLSFYFYPAEDTSAGIPSQRWLECAEQQGYTEHEDWCVRQDGSRFSGRIPLSPPCGTMMPPCVDLLCDPG